MSDFSKYFFVRLHLTFSLLLVPLLVQAAPVPTPVLLVSIDGLRPIEWLQSTTADLPTLSALRNKGTFAKGVVGITPTVTYPSHTTLITGVSPALHGIFSNTTFDPTNINQVGWYWFAEDIKVPTLFSAARAKGLRTANVHWPVTVGEPIDFNLPQIWRTGHDDDRKLSRALSTSNLQTQLEKVTNLRYPNGIKEDLEDDLIRAQFGEALISSRRPQFAAVYLTALDHNQHIFGPDTPESKNTLIALDKALGKLIETARKTNPNTVVCVVSDHGFAPLTQDVNLVGAFIKAGFIDIDSKTNKVSNWTAVPWYSGGSAAVVLKNPSDNVVHNKVKILLAELAGNPDLGIEEVVDQAALAARGANPQASFWVEFKLGYQMGTDPSAAMLAPSKSKGMHGYAPTRPEMHSTFIIEGKGIAQNKNLGLIDMRDIAPTIAQLLGVKLGKSQGQSVLGR